MQYLPGLEVAVMVMVIVMEVREVMEVYRSSNTERLATGPLTSHILISSTAWPTLDSDKNPLEVISMIKCVTVISIIKRGISRQINL